MKKCLAVLFLLAVSLPAVRAQKNIIGLWKPVRIGMPDVGEMPVQPDALRKYAYEKTRSEKPGEPLTAQDSADVESLVEQMQSQFGSLTMQFNANKTYTAVTEGKSVTGKWSYDAARKILTTIPPKKTPRKARLSFVNGLMKLENINEKIVLYLQRVPA